MTYGEWVMALFHMEFGNNRLVGNEWLDDRDKPPKKWICGNKELKILVKVDGTWLSLSSEGNRKD